MTSHTKRLIDYPRLNDRVPASKMTLWRWEKEGRFPKRVKINGRNFWVEAEVDEYIENLANSRT